MLDVAAHLQTTLELPADLNVRASFDRLFADGEVLTIGTLLVGVLAHVLMPEIGWPVAIALGAILSPTDAIAATALLRDVGAPRRVVTLLESETLFNDATALVTYRLAVAASVTGVFSATQASMQFLIGGAGGVAIGLLIGVVVAKVHRLTRSVPVVSNTVSLLTPYASYLLADIIGTSGILAVLATGLYAARTVPKVLGAQTRLQITGMWTVVTFLLESLIFILVGLELPYVTRAFDRLLIARLFLAIVVALKFRV